jgi:hypothetical protein
MISQAHYNVIEGTFMHYYGLILIWISKLEEIICKI